MKRILALLLTITVLLAASCTAPTATDQVDHSEGLKLGLASFVGMSVLLGIIIADDIVDALEQ